MAVEVHLEEMLKKRNMTSKELAKLIGITEANLSILRSGKAKGVRFETINKICFYLDCQIGDILKFDGKLEGKEDE
ncbi:MAG: helix-turn-helix domain-containing protein [Intestinibacter sp.]